MESGQPFTADRNLRMGIVARRGGLWDAPNREYREKFILLDATCDDPEAQIHLRGGRVLITMDQLLLPPRSASANTTLVGGMCPLTNRVPNFPLYVAVESF